MDKPCQNLHAEAELRMLCMIGNSQCICLSIVLQIDHISLQVVCCGAHSSINPSGGEAFSMAQLWRATTHSPVDKSPVARLQGVQTLQRTFVPVGGS